MADDFDFSNGFDFKNPVHTALLDDSHGRMKRRPRMPSGCLTLLLLTVTGICLLLRAF